MPSADQDARIRLGQLLTGRRAQISARYKNRREFAADTGLNWRLLYDVEQAKRDNFRPETLRAFESAYHLAPGSIDRVLAGGDLEPLPDAPRIAAVPDSAIPRTPREEDADEAIEALIAGNEVLRLLWNYPDPKGPVGKLLDRKTRLAMMRQWITADPRGALDDEGRRGTGTA
jgi:hypothetical protein